MPAAARSARRGGRGPSRARPGARGSGSDRGPGRLVSFRRGGARGRRDTPSPRESRTLRGRLEPLGMGREPTEQEPPAERGAAQPFGVQEKRPPEYTSDGEHALDPLHRGTPGSPASRRRQRHDGARPPSLCQLEREPAAKRVPGDMRAVPADGVELALEPVGQCIDPWCDAGREGLAFEMAQQGRGEHLEGVLEVLRDRLPNPSRRGKAVDAGGLDPCLRRRGLGDVSVRSYLLLDR